MMNDFMPYVAVDYDGTLVKEADKYPSVGTPNMVAVRILKEYKRIGGKVILWTCREGAPKQEAISQMNQLGLFFDSHNDDLEEQKKAWWNKFPNAPLSHKAHAYLYIDDRNPEAVYSGGINWEHICEMLLGYHLEKLPA